MSKLPVCPKCGAVVDPSTWKLHVKWHKKPNKQGPPGPPGPMGPMGSPGYTPLPTSPITPLVTWSKES